MLRMGNVFGRALGPVREDIRSGNINGIGDVVTAAAVEYPSELDVVRIRLDFAINLYRFVSGGRVNVTLARTTNWND